MDFRPGSRSGATLCIVGLALTAGTAPPARVAASPAPAFLDFTAAGQGPFDPNFFSKSDKVVFDAGSFVGYVQGDEALIGPIAWRVQPPRVGPVTVRLAPAIQGSARYTLTAWSASGEPVAMAETVVTQDSGNPATGPFGYVVLRLEVTEAARSFTLTSTFLGSTFPHVTTIDFGVADIALPGR